MNKQRRANIQKTIELLDKYKSDAEKIESSIKTLLETEEQHRDNIPAEPRYEHLIEKADCACDYIGAAGEYMEESKSFIDDVINSLQKAME